MKKLFGFTLAEVLVTMGIVGVIAALTTPVVVTNVRRQGYATTLKATMGDLENTFANAMVTEQSDGITGTSLFNGNNTNFANAMPNYMQTRRITQAATREFYNNENNLQVHALTNNGGIGDDITDTLPNSDTIERLYLKNGAVAFFEAIPVNERTANSVADVIIDINGTGAPNNMARDIFRFRLSDGGQLIPYGSDAIENIINDNGCPNGTLAGNNNGASCTNRLVENGFVFDF